MTALLVVLLFFLLLLVLIGGMGIGIGFLLHWLIPAIGVDIGTLIGVVTLSWTISLYARLMSAILSIEKDLETPDSTIETIVFQPIRRSRATKRKK